MINVWLDDERETPEGWVNFKTAWDCIEFMKNNSGKVDIISLDHDLGDDFEHGTGYNVICWIEEQIHVNNEFIPPNDIRIHTANASARQKMENALKGIKSMLIRKSLQHVKEINFKTSS